MAKHVATTSEHVSWRNQLCYDIRLADYGEDVVFHIVCCNFKVITEGPVPFNDERTVPQVDPAPFSANRGGGVPTSNEDDGNIF